MSDARLAGSTAIVTGAGRGIGAAIASELAHAGARVAVLGRSAAELDSIVANLPGGNELHAAFTCDVADPDQVAATIAKIEAELGRPSILVNNAGGWDGVQLADSSATRVVEMVDSIVVGSMLMSRAVIPLFELEGGGAILNIGSTSGLSGSQDSTIASTPKAALGVFTQTLAREVGARNIRVGILHPSSVDKDRDETLAESPGDDGKYLTTSPRQIAEAALFMLTRPQNVTVREMVVTPTHAYI